MHHHRLVPCIGQVVRQIVLYRQSLITVVSVLKSLFRTWTISKGASLTSNLSSTQRIHMQSCSFKLIYDVSSPSMTYVPASLISWKIPLNIIIVGHKTNLLMDISCERYLLFSIYCFKPGHSADCKYKSCIWDFPLFLHFLKEQAFTLER